MFGGILSRFLFLEIHELVADESQIYSQNLIGITQLGSMNHLTQNGIYRRLISHFEPAAGRVQV